MKILKMTKEHAPVLAELERRCFSHPWSREALQAEAENLLGCFVVAEENGELLGYGGMHCVCGECYVANIAVFPEHRRKGAGRAVLQALEQEARRRDGEFLTLEVRASNHAAIALYTSLGFAEEGRRRDFYSDPTEDGLLMTKRFSGEA